MTNENERKEIEKLEGTGMLTVDGFYGNDGAFGRSYLLFSGDRVFSINGYAARQFAEKEFELLGKTFTLKYTTKHSKKYNKDYIVLTGITVLEDRTTLKIEYESE